MHSLLPREKLSSWLFIFSVIFVKYYMIAVDAEVNGNVRETFAVHSDSWLFNVFSNVCGVVYDSSVCRGGWKCKRDYVHSDSWLLYISSNACGVVYDSSGCRGGWKLIIFLRDYCCTQWLMTISYFQ